MLTGTAPPQTHSDEQARGLAVAPLRGGRRQQRRWRGTLLLVDVVALGAAWGTSGYPGHSPTRPIIFSAAVLLLMQARVHKASLRTCVLDEIGPIASATFMGAGLVIAVELIIRPELHSASEVAPVSLLATAYLIGGRCGQRLARNILRRGRRPQCRTLVVGTGPVARLVARRLHERPEFGLDPVGFLDDGLSMRPFAEIALDDEIPLLGGISDLEEQVRIYGVDHVVVTFSNASHEVLSNMIWRCRREGLQVLLLPRLYEAMPGDMEVEHLGGIPLLRIRPIPLRDSRLLILKHTADRVFAACLLLVLSPLMLAIALAVQLSSVGPIFFRERRMGLRGREFEILKFRTMTHCSEDHMSVRAAVLLGDDPISTVTERRTAVGRVLRKTSLDELPQLINVLRGEMSIVGPRPESPSLVRIFQETIYRYDDRHRVRAGMTGWAQVQGLRGTTSLIDRIEWDNFYIEHWSLWFDLKILLLTIPAVLSGRNAE